MGFLMRIGGLRIGIMLAHSGPSLFRFVRVFGGYYLC